MVASTQASPGQQGAPPQQQHHHQVPLLGLVGNICSFLSVGDLVAYISHIAPKEASATGTGTSARPGRPSPSARAPERAGEEEEEEDGGAGVLLGLLNRARAPQQPEQDAGAFSPSCTSLEEGLLLKGGGGHKLSGREEEGGGDEVPLLVEQAQHKRGGVNPVVGMIGSIVWISTRPSVMAFDAIRGLSAAVLDKLPLLALLQWGCEHMAAGWHLAERLARLPLTVGHHIAGAIVGAIDTLMLVAAEVWQELRRLGVKELFCVVACLLRRQQEPEDTTGSTACSSGASGGIGVSVEGGGRALRRGSRHLGGGGNGSGLVPASASQFSVVDPFGDGVGGGGGGGDSGGGAGYAYGLGERHHPLYHHNHLHSAAAEAAMRARQAQLRARLDRVNRTAPLLEYQEKVARSISGGGGGGGGGGAAAPAAAAASGDARAAERVRRMMHYDVPLNPFQATVAVDPHSVSPLSHGGDGSRGGADSVEGGGGLALYMCTPQSFPPSPISRACVMTRSAQFSDDVLFLARDQLRLDEQCRAPHSDETSRLTAEFLRSQARLAVLNGRAAADGIVLTCGHHCAAKAGAAQLYSSVRAMVPVLRNRYVFCQFSVTAQEAVAPSLSIGLSTPDMPLNTLVGTWSHSIGLSSAGQVLLSSRWFSCAAGRGAYGVGSTIGVLVYLDSTRTVSSWNGEMVTAFVTYSVNGQPIHTAQRGGGGGAEGGGVSGGGGGGDGSSTLALPLPRDRDLFPTLTLHSPATQVLCRFCAADMVHATRARIGAPPGVPVYALDGSLVLSSGAQ